MHASCASWTGSGPSRSYKPSPPPFSSPVPRPSSLRTRAAGVAIRSSRPNSRLSSFVNPRGISRGPQPPGRWGRIPKGTAFGIGSLWRISFASFFGRAKKEARRRRRDRETKRRDKRRIRRSPEDCSLWRGRGQDEGSFAPAGATFFRSAAKEGKDAPEGTYFEAVPSGLPPRRPRGLRPHWIPHFWTKDVRRGDGRVNGLPQPVCAPASQ